jgi:phosphoglycolate phosphatase
MKSAEKTKQYEGILFDLDGTLADNFAAIHKSVNYAQRLQNLPLSDFETVRKTVGGSLHLTLTKLVGEENFDRSYELYMECFTKTWKDNLETLPYVFSSIQKLKNAGYKMAVLTNKQGPSARKVTDAIQVDQFMEFVLGTRDTPYRKPEKEFTETALKRLGIPKEKVCYIGDGPYDVNTAKNAGIDVYLVATGTHSLEEMKGLETQGNFPNMRELTEAVFNI